MADALDPRLGKHKVTMPDGSIVYFPGDMPDVQVHAEAGKLLGPTPPGPKGSAVIPGDSALQAPDPRAFSELLPMAGSYLGPYGTATATALKHTLQGVSPSTFGEPPKDLLSGLLDIGKEIGLNNTIPSVLKYGFSKLPSVARLMEGDRVAGNAAELKQRFMGPGTEPIPEGEAANYKSNSQTGALTPEGMAAQKLIQGTNETRGLINKGFSPSSGSIDAPKILDELGKNPEKYSNIPAETKQNLTDFFTEVSKQKPIAAHEGMIMSYEKRRLAFAIPGMALGGLAGAAVGHEGVGALAAGSIILGDKATEALLTKYPTLAKVAIQALKTKTTDESAPMISKMILYGLRGTEAIVQAPDGKKEKVQIGQDGQIQYPQPQGQ